MNRDKQIEEMAKDICRVEERCIVGCQPTPKCRAFKYAERSVDKGYRKASEVAEEIIEMIINEPTDNLPYITYLYGLNLIEKIKEKYTESEKDNG